MAKIVERMDDNEFVTLECNAEIEGDICPFHIEARRARAMEKQLLDERELHRAAEFHKKEQNDKL